MLCLFHTYIDSFIASSRILYFQNILISECNNKSLYCKDKSLSLNQHLSKYVIALSVLILLI